jgi:hypothetical protein
VPVLPRQQVLFPQLHGNAPTVPHA